MTHPFEIDPTPDELEIVCPRCGSAARFTFAREIVVESRRARAELAREKGVELERRIDGNSGLRTFAVVFPHLGGARGRVRGSRVKSRGTCRCAACGSAHKHSLRWPEDALFRCDVRGRVLWAWDRAHAVVLCDFIAGADRRPEWLFLLHVPTSFLTRGARTAAVKKLDRLLEERGR